MAFSGIAFSGVDFSGCRSVSSDMKSVYISGGKVDSLYITKDINESIIPEDDTPWTKDTIVHARFNETLIGGNIDVLLSDTSAIVIRRREKGTSMWTEIFRKTISGEKDFQFSIYDTSARSGVTYEYAFTPVLPGQEGAMTITEAACKHDGVFIIGAGDSYYTDAGVSLNVDRSFDAQTITTIGRRYPLFASFGKHNYDTGTISGIFAIFDKERCTYRFDGSALWREKLIQFLSDGMPKIIKTWDGRIWVACIMSPISVDSGRTQRISMRFEQIASPSDTQMLRQFSLIHQE